MKTDYRSRPNREGVERFFQDNSENGLRAQVRWCMENLNMTEAYFANMLHTDTREIEQWQRRDAHLMDSRQEVLRAFWRLHLHLRTFWDSDNCAVRKMLEYKSLAPELRAVPPPWQGMSIKEYIERGGIKAIEDVQGWLENLRVPRAM